MTLVQIWSGETKEIPNPDGALDDKLPTKDFCDETSM
jgi:hypothetical protein